jgi:hypothetical protein
VRVDPRGGLGDILEPQPLQPDPRLLLQALHHRVMKLSLAREVPVDGPLADFGPFGDGADGQAAPVPGRRLMGQLHARGDDTLARLGGTLAAQAAVIPAALLRWLAHDYLP